MSISAGIYKTLTVAAVIEELKGIKTIVFEKGHDVAYKAGQYLTLVRFEGGEELRRSYSITSSPQLNEPLAIGVKRIENGVFSRWLVDYCKPGDQLTTSGSGGFFVLPEEIHSYSQLFFFAAGSGITPVFSLLKTALHSSPQLKVILAYSNASEDKTIFLQALKTLERQFRGRLHLHFVFSNEADLSKARLTRDLIISFLKQYRINENKKGLFYICGPESYMRLCTYTLQAEGIQPSLIRKENFYFSTVKKRDALPFDKRDHQVSIDVGARQYDLTVHYPDSILRAAKKQGITLPYSCEAGRCGNCVARCTKGMVWHSYNEVLTDRELSQGLVLTCVGHPESDVVLEIR